MTLQIGMLGSNGVVLAGDTWCYRMPLPQFQGKGALWDGYHRSKIKISASRRIAISSAVEMNTADLVADQLLAEIEHTYPDLRETTIQRIVGDVNPQNEFECIAAFLDPQPSLYSIQYRTFQNQLHLTAIPMLEYCTAGDSMNPAIFWPMRYCKRHLNTEALMRVGIHTVVMASEQSSGNIRGLEVAISRQDGFARISQADCELMMEEAKERAAKIGDIVTSPSLA